MELETFIEKDIVEFLDRRSAEITDRAESLREEEFSLYEITEDYLKEIDSALNSGNVNRAREIFEEVKQKQASAADGSISKKRLYTILEEVYEKIKDYEEGAGGKKKLFETVREYEQKGLFANPEVFKSKEEQATGLIISSIKAKEREIEELIGKDKPTAEEISLAVKKYQEVKEFIKKIPKSNIDLLSKVTSEAISIFDDINKAKNIFIEQAKQAPKTELEIANANLSVEEKLSRIRLIKEKLVELHDKIETSIEKRDLRNAIEDYRKLRQICESFPDDLSEEKTALLADAASLFDKIERLKQEFYKSQAAIPKTYTETIAEKRRLDETDTEILDKKISKARNELLQSHRAIDTALAKKDITGAMREYSNLKNLSQAFPKEAAEERIAILSEALAVFERIKKMKENILRKEKEKQEDEEQKQMQKQAFNEYKKTVDEKINNIKELLKINNSKSAIEEFSNLKNYLANIPDDDYDSKKALYNEVLESHLDMKVLDQDHKNKLSMQNEEADKIKQMRLEITRIMNLIASKDNSKFDEITQSILELKHKTVILSNDFFEEKYEFMKLIDDLESKLIAAKTIDRITIQQNELKGATQ